MDHAQPTDEIVAEVRRNREKLLSDAGGTLEGLYAKLKKLESQESRRVVKLPPRPLPRATPEAA